MHPLLNGWRRLGIVIAAAWFIAIAVLAVYEFSSPSGGSLVYRSIPIGTTVAGNKITLPDGKVITLTEEEEFKLRFQREQRTDHPNHALPPWELDWSTFSAVPKVTQINWLRIILLAVAVPSLLWLFVELILLVATWVRRGFSAPTK